MIVRPCFFVCLVLVLSSPATVLKLMLLCQIVLRFGLVSKKDGKAYECKSFCGMCRQVWQIKDGINLSLIRINGAQLSELQTEMLDNVRDDPTLAVKRLVVREDGRVSVPISSPSRPSSAATMTPVQSTPRSSFSTPTPAATSTTGIVNFFAMIGKPGLADRFIFGGHIRDHQFDLMSVQEMRLRQDHLHLTESEIQLIASVPRDLV